MPKNEMDDAIKKAKAEFEKRLAAKDEELSECKAALAANVPSAATSMVPKAEMEGAIEEMQAKFDQLLAGENEELFTVASRASSKHNTGCAFCATVEGEEGEHPAAASDRPDVWLEENGAESDPASEQGELSTDADSDDNSDANLDVRSTPYFTPTNSPFDNFKRRNHMAPPVLDFGSDADDTRQNMQMETWLEATFATTLSGAAKEKDMWIVCSINNEVGEGKIEVYTSQNQYRFQKDVGKTMPKVSLFLEDVETMKTIRGGQQSGVSLVAGTAHAGSRLTLLTTNVADCEHLQSLFAFCQPDLENSGAIVAKASPTKMAAAGKFDTLRRKKIQAGSEADSTAVELVEPAQELSPPSMKGGSRESNLQTTPGDTFAIHLNETPNGKRLLRGEEFDGFGMDLTSNHAGDGRSETEFAGFGDLNV